MISDREYGYEKVNVADERRDSESLLNWTERIIRMRKECPEISWGGFEVLRTNVPEVLAIRPYGCRWMRVGAIGNTLERSDLDLTNPMR